MKQNLVGCIELISDTRNFSPDFALPRLVLVCAIRITISAQEAERI